MRVSKHEPRPISNRGRLMTNTQTHVAVLMGGWSVGARGVAPLRRGLRRCARSARLPRDPPRCRPRRRRPGSPSSDPMSASMRCTAASARMAASRACSRRSASPTPTPACSPRLLPCIRSRPRRCMRAAGVPVAEAVVLTRGEAARAHAMKPPYVIKPVTEGSSVGVFIVREDQRHPPQELPCRRLDPRRGG